MSALTTKTARSIIYVGCIGGLLVVNSFVVTTAWNSFVAEEREENRLTLLEGAGITAFAYVALSGIRYACRPKSTMLDSIRLSAKQSSCQTSAEAKDALRERCSQMSQEQKADLKRQLEEQCGCSDRLPVTEKINP